jgi:hypothetical protein
MCVVLQHALLTVVMHACMQICKLWTPSQSTFQLAFYAQPSSSDHIDEAELELASDLGGRSQHEESQETDAVDAQFSLDDDTSSSPDNHHAEDEDEPLQAGRLDVADVDGFLPVTAARSTTTTN